MRIIAGRYRGRQILCPAGDHVRPTSDRTRESIFNLLASRMSFEGIRAVDLFAGSGAFGFESLSRGAKSATFIDINTKSLLTIRQNAQNLGIADDQIEIKKTDGLRWIRKEMTGSFQLVFADPPYSYEQSGMLIDLIRKPGSPFRQLWFVFESSGDFSHPAFSEAVTERQYGGTKTVIFAPETE